MRQRQCHVPYRRRARQQARPSSSRGRRAFVLMMWHIVWQPEVIRAIFMLMQRIVTQSEVMRAILLEDSAHLPWPARTQ